MSQLSNDFGSMDPGGSFLMANTADLSTLTPRDSDYPIYNRERNSLWNRVALGAVLLLSIFMNFFQLGQNGYGNLYYASGVRSMVDSWHNFFFVSFDPGGFVTIDKPPFGFWLQTLSAKLFGFTAFSIFLPQALCGVLAVLLLYFLVRRHFGEGAGLIAALVLAVTPISVVTNRNNTIDGTLALILLLAAWAVIHAAETGKLRWLLLSGVFVGLGFNTKMAEAYLVLPALAMTYLLCAPHKLWTRIWQLLMVMVVMVVISLSWAAAVDMTPVSQRPYVGSTQDNSEICLAVGYNGLSRLRIGGNNNGRNQACSNIASNSTAEATAFPTNPATTGATPPQGRNTGGLGNAPNRTRQAAGGVDQTGATGPFRLFNVSLGGQIAWLLPFALLALVALALRRRFNFKQDRQLIGFVLWGFWLIAMAAFFTLDGSFHQYYMTEMAPGLSALVGIGLVVMWRAYRAVGWRGWLLPLALAVTAGAQLYMLASYPTWSRWLSPLIAALTLLAVIGLIGFRLGRRWRLSEGISRAANIVVGVGMFALLIAPTLWSGYSVFHNTESSFPTAGPGTQTNFANFFKGGQGAGGITIGFGGGTAQTDSTLISYLEAHQGNAKFLVATPSSTTADALILATNKPVMALGGFSGGDPILTTSQLQTLIQNGTVRFFLMNAPRTTTGNTGRTPNDFPDFVRGGGGGGGFAGFGGGAQNALSQWITGHCRVVPTSSWQSPTQGARAGGGGNRLYDCAAAAA